MEYFTVWDIALFPLYIGIIYLIAYRKKKRNIENNPEYKYYIPGLSAKIFGGIFLCLIYTLYYRGGDTLAYYDGSVAMVNLLFKDPSSFFSILSGNLSAENYYSFDSFTGRPYGYMYRDPQTFSVIRLSSIFTLIGAKSLIITTALLAWITYSGIWRLYLLFSELFPDYKKHLAIAILFMPSVIFWGSGILKDSYTICAAAWIVYNVYNLFIKKRKPFFHILSLIVSVYILVSIKPYIFFAILLGVIVWIFFILFTKIKSRFIRFVVLPLFIVLIISTGSLVYLIVSGYVGGYYGSVEGMIQKAVITQEDLTRETYGANSFDIGKFDPTIPGIMSKAPQAIVAGLFRPFLWECRNPVMLLSGVENTFLLLLCLYLIFKVRIRYMIKMIIDNALIMFSLVFSLFFSFSVGLSTANFGALVRYKIPLIPFFVASLLIIIYSYRKMKKEKSEAET